MNSRTFLHSHDFRTPNPRHALKFNKNISKVFSKEFQTLHLKRLQRIPKILYTFPSSPYMDVLERVYA